MLPWQPFLAFYIWGARWRHLKNTTETSMCSGDAALCQITLTIVYINRDVIVGLFDYGTYVKIIAAAFTAEHVH